MNNQGKSININKKKLQVWQICSVAQNTCIENGLKYEDVVKPKLDNPGTYKYIEVAEDSDLNDLEGVKRCLAQEESHCATGKKISDKEDSLRIINTKECDKSSIDAEPTNRSKIVDSENENENCVITSEYNCQLCLQSFDSLSALKIHVSDHFFGGKERILPDEPEEEDENVFGYGDNLENSIESKVTNATRENKGEARKNCNREDEECPDTGYDDNLDCHSSDEIFETTKELTLKGEKDSSLKELECRYCDKLFFKLSARKYHEQNFHHQNEKKHLCDECGKEFAKRSELRYHKGIHANPPSNCSICNKHFRNAQSYKMHIKRHTLGSRYNCVECGKSYYTNSELARHVQQHTGMREFPCHLCDMSFLSKPELNRHFKYHNGEKKFECKICLKTYYESGHLKVHERVHTGERPFACTICSKGFITKSKLVRHVKIHDRQLVGRRDR